MKRILILPLIFFTLNAWSQIQSITPMAIDDMFVNNRYGASWSYYSDQLIKDPSNEQLNYKMGVCYLNSRSQKAKALDYFNRVFVLSDPDKIVDHRQLAEAYYYANKFDQALIHYKKYEKTLLSKKELDRNELKITDLKINMCYMGKQIKELKSLVDSLMDHKCSDALEIIDSLCPNVIKGSTAYGFSKTILASKLLHEDEFFEGSNIITSDIKPTVTPSLADTSSITKEATVATSVDGQIILLYRYEGGEGHIYASGLVGNEWTEPRQLQKSANNKGWEPNEFISEDGNTLFFSYDRPGGYGGKDIYKCVRLPNGEWGRAVNMGPGINTAFDEEAPYIHSDGKILYFSSNRYKTKGGWDIFTSSLADSGAWTLPVKTGYPLSHYKEVKQDVKKGDNISKCYTATFIDQKNNRLTLMHGKVLEKNGANLPHTEITVTNNKTGEVAGAYNTDQGTGDYLFVLPQEDDVNVTYNAKGYMLHSENLNSIKEENYTMRSVVELVPIVKGAREVLNNTFFITGTASLTANSTTELEQLYQFLNTNKEITLELLIGIKKKSTKVEMALAEEKLRSIHHYLVEKGIREARVTTKVYAISKRMRKRAARTGENNFGKIEIQIIELR